MSLGVGSPYRTRKGVPRKALVAESGAKQSQEFTFTQADVQLWYDGLLVSGTESDDALQSTLDHFDLEDSEVELTPAGWLIVQGMEVDPVPTDGQVIPTANDPLGGPAQSAPATVGT